MGFYSGTCWLKVSRAGSNQGHHGITQSGKTSDKQGERKPFAVIKEILQERSGGSLVAGQPSIIYFADVSVI